ncbi:hypothetical protein CSB11_00490 [Candidatus Campbellbacteria bacterium]|nr:MAG: hypothetical protein CSB11_00490 [Candidatus Campbellbacteria bacterium]
MKTKHKIQSVIDLNRIVRTCELIMQAGAASKKDLKKKRRIICDRFGCAPGYKYELDESDIAGNNFVFDEGVIKINSTLTEIILISEDGGIFDFLRSQDDYLYWCETTLKWVPSKIYISERLPDGGFTEHLVLH